MRQEVKTYIMHFLIIFVLFIIAALLYFKQKYSYWKNRNVPSEGYTFPFGSIGGVVLMQTFLSRYCSKLYKKHQGLPYVGFYNFLSPALLVRDVDLIKDVLITKFHHFADNWITVDFSVDPLMAKNLFHLCADEWKVVRHQLTPQYSVSKFKQMVPIMEQSGNVMIDYMHNHLQDSESKCFEIQELATRYTGEVVLMAIFGLEGKSFEVETPVTFTINDEVSTNKYFVAIKQTIGLFFPLLRKLFNVTYIGCPIPKSFWSLVLDTIKYREENNIARNDYLDFIRDLKQPGVSPYEITDAYTVALAYTFFLDSLETSSILMTFVMYELARNSNIQEKARQEAIKIMRKYNGTLTYEATVEMKYIDNVITEGVRKYPILAFLSRICTKECTFPPPGERSTGKDLVIEKGTAIFISPLAVHHDEQYFPDPEKFDPDRFTEEAKSTRPKIAFLGFGEGPRMCLGRNYGFLQIKVALTLLLKNFEFRLNKDCKPLEMAPLHMLNVPKDGVIIDFYKLTR